MKTEEHYPLFKVYIITLVLLVVIDALWLGIISPGLYSHYLNYITTKHPNLFAALIFYVIFAVGLVYFIVWPELHKKNTFKLILSSFLFGLVSYATFDLSALAVINKWPIGITLIDISWGCLISVLTSFISISIVRKYLPKKS